MASSNTISTRIRSDAIAKTANAPVRRATPNDESSESSFEQVLSEQSRPQRKDKPEETDAKKTATAKKSQKPAKPAAKKKTDEASADDPVEQVQPTQAVEESQPKQVEAEVSDESEAQEVKVVAEKQPVVVTQPDQAVAQQQVNPAAQPLEVKQDTAPTPQQSTASAQSKPVEKSAVSKPKAVANVAVEKPSDQAEAGGEPQVEETTNPAPRQSKPMKAAEQPAASKPKTVSPLAPALAVQPQAAADTTSDAEGNEGNIEIDITQFDPSELAELDFDIEQFAPADKKPVAIDEAAPTAAFAIDTSAKPVEHHMSPAPVQPQAPPEVRFAEENHPQIVTNVRGHLLPNGGTMAIRLDPPELGDLQLLVQMRDGVMSAAFQTSNDQATHLLSHSLGELRTALEASGISVDRLHVEQAPKDQQARNENSDARQQHGQAQDSPARRDQQRRELLDRMWKKLRGDDDIDLVA